VLQAEPSVAAIAVPLLQARAVSVPSLTLSFAAIGAFRCRDLACAQTILLMAFMRVHASLHSTHGMSPIGPCLPVLCRGLRDTKTPLWGTAASTVVNYGLHVLFMGSYGWGVLGAGWAVVWGQWVGSALLVGRLGTVGAIHWPDMLKLSSGDEMVATLKAMVALSVTYLVQVRNHRFHLLGMKRAQAALDAQALA